MSGREPGGDGEQDRLNKNWLRSRLRQIRTFVTSRRNRTQSGRGQLPLPNDSKRAGEADGPSVDGELDGDDDANLYLMVDHLGNDEEIAMIRACSQMSK